MFSKCISSAKLFDFAESNVRLQEHGEKGTLPTRTWWATNSIISKCRKFPHPSQGIHYDPEKEGAEEAQKLNKSLIS